MPWAYFDGRRGVAPVTMPEVIEAARRLNPDMPELKLATARTWVTRGMVSAAVRQAGQGRGRGRVGDYPDIAAQEMAVAGFLKFGLQTPFREIEIARARSVWVVNDRSATGLEAEALLPGLLIAATCRPMTFELGTIESLQRAVDVLVYGAKMEQIDRGIDVRWPVKAVFELWYSDYPSIDLRLLEMEPAETELIAVDAKKLG